MQKTLGCPEYKALLSIFVNFIEKALGDNLLSIALYGSVARGRATAHSDVDLLFILREVPLSYWRRLQSILPILRQLRMENCWKALENKGVIPFLSLVILSLEEAKESRYLYLDMVEEARILVDWDDFFRQKLETIRQRLKKLGAQKVRSEGSGYWDLRPGLKTGDVIVL